MLCHSIDTCVEFHKKVAKMAGVSKEEMLEAAAIGGLSAWAQALPLHPSSWMIRNLMSLIPYNSLDPFYGRRYHRLSQCCG